MYMHINIYEYLYIYSLFMGCAGDPSASSVPHIIPAARSNVLHHRGGGDQLEPDSGVERHSRGSHIIPAERLSVFQYHLLVQSGHEGGHD